VGSCCQHFCSPHQQLQLLASSPAAPRVRDLSVLLHQPLTPSRQAAMPLSPAAINSCRRAQRQGHPIALECVTAYVPCVQVGVTLLCSSGL